MSTGSTPDKPPVRSGGPPPGTADEYAMVTEAPQPAVAASGAVSGGLRANWWYVPRATGKREGPVVLDGLKQLMASGGLSADDLVWREGMAEWVPARNVPELAGPQAGAAPFPAAPAASAPAGPSPRFERTGAGPSPADFLKPFQELVSRPVFFRMVGLACIALCGLWLFIGIVVSLFGVSSRGWFTEALLFAVFFFLSQGIAAILERLDRMQ